MPSRKRIVRVECDEVQGEDSYMVIRKMTVADARTAMEAIRDARKINKDDEIGGALAILNRSVERYQPNVLEWNWVDDDGNPLPQPTDPDVFPLLTSQEMQFIGRAIGATGGDQGNSETGSGSGTTTEKAISQ